MITILNEDINVNLNDEPMGYDDHPNPSFNTSNFTDGFFKKVQEIVDYFKYHNKNLNKTQDYLLYDLEDALDSRSTIAAREAIANLQNHTRGMTNAQSSLIEELYEELFYSDGLYQNLGKGK